MKMRPRALVCVETFSSYPPLGRFAIRDHGRTIGVGVIKEAGKNPNRWNTKPGMDFSFKACQREAPLVPLRPGITCASSDGVFLVPKTRRSPKRRCRRGVRASTNEGSVCSEKKMRRLVLLRGGDALTQRDGELQPNKSKDTSLPLSGLF